MQSKNKRKATLSLDNISTSYVIGNNHVANDIVFNIVEPGEEQKRYVLTSFIIHQNSVLT